MASYAAAIGITLAAMLIAGAGVPLVRRFARLETLRKHHEIAVSIFLQIGVLYAVLLAFAVTVVWGQFDEATKAVDGEATGLTMAFHLASGLPPPAREAIHRGVLHYVQTVIADEWPAMDERRTSARTMTALQDLWRAGLAFEPASTREGMVYRATIDKLAEARHQRGLRILHNDLRVPGFVWALLLAVGAVVLGLSYFFGLEFVAAQAAMTAALAGTIALTLMTIALLDAPFSGSLRVPPEPLEVVLSGLQAQVGR